MKTFLTFLTVFAFAASIAAQRQSDTGMPLFWIREDGKYGYIDKTGKVVIPPQFENTMGFSEGVAATRIDGKYGYIDVEGNWVIKPQFDFTYKFSEGLAMVRVGKLFGWIDRAGKMVIEPREYDQVADGFSEGRVAVRKDGKWGYIDRTGRVIAEPKYKKASRFNGGVAQVETEDGMHHWMNAEGKIIWSQNPNEKRSGHATNATH